MLASIIRQIILTASQRAWLTSALCPTSRAVSFEERSVDALRAAAADQSVIAGQSIGNHRLLRLGERQFTWLGLKLW